MHTVAVLMLLLMMLPCKYELQLNVLNEVKFPLMI